MYSFLKAFLVLVKLIKSVYGQHCLSVIEEGGVSFDLS